MSALEAARRGPLFQHKVFEAGGSAAGLTLPFPLPPRPLHIAARNGLASVVQALLSRGATVLAVDEEGACSSRVPGVGVQRDVPGGRGLPGEALSRDRKDFRIPSVAELHVLSSRHRRNSLGEDIVSTLRSPGKALPGPAGV